MHPRAQEFVRHLPDELDVYVDDDDGDGMVTVAYGGHALAFFHPGLDHVVLQVGLLVEVDPDTNTTRVHSSDLAATFAFLDALEADGLEWTDHRIEPVGYDERESILLIRLDGFEVPIGFVHGVLLWTWEASLPAIRRSNEVKEKETHRLPAPSKPETTTRSHESFDSSVE